MPLTLELLTPPVEEPVTVEEVVKHVRIDEVSSEYNLLESYITMARESVEIYLRRQLLTATWRLSLDTFPNLIRVPRPPLQSVTTIEYQDAQNVQQTLPATEYQVDTASEPGRIMVARGRTWPTTASETFNAVQITYVAGATTAAGVSAAIRLALMMLVGDFYEHREAQLDTGFALQRIEQNVRYGQLKGLHRVLDL